MNQPARTSACGLLGVLVLLSCTGCYDLVGSGPVKSGLEGLSPEGEATYRRRLETDFFGTHSAGIVAITSEEAKAFGVLYEEPADVRDAAFERLLKGRRSRANSTASRGST